MHQMLVELAICRKEKDGKQAYESAQTSEVKEKSYELYSTRGDFFEETSWYRTGGLTTSPF